MMGHIGLSMEIPVDVDTMWWLLNAGRDGVLERDWLEQDIVTTGWGGVGDFSKYDRDGFQNEDPSDQYVLSKFVGYHEEGMTEGDVVIAYAPVKGHVVGIGKVGEIRYDEDHSWIHLDEQRAIEAKVVDHYYQRPIDWFDWGTPVKVTELSKRFQVHGADQLTTGITLNRYGTLATHQDRIETLVEEVIQCEPIKPTRDVFGPQDESGIQEWIVNNIRELGLEKPKTEVHTSVGRMDVLATSEDGETIIEIKHGTAGDSALGQLLGYIGARREESSTSVNGILVADGFTSRVKKAVRGQEAVELYEIKVDVSLEKMR